MISWKCIDARSEPAVKSAPIAPYRGGFSIPTRHEGFFLPSSSSSFSSFFPLIHSEFEFR